MKKQRSYILLIIIVLIILSVLLGRQLLNDRRKTNADTNTSTNQNSGITAADDRTYQSRERIEWGDITDFSLHCGSFHGGYVEYRIEHQDGVYLFTSKGREGAMRDVEKQLITDKEVAELCSILQDNNIDTWDGFGKSDQNVLDGWSYQLLVELDTGDSIQTSGYEAYPDGFEPGFGLMTGYLNKLAFQYYVMPEWGNMISFRYFYAPDLSESCRYTIGSDGDNIMLYANIDGPQEADIQGTLAAERFEELQELLFHYGIDKWSGIGIADGSDDNRQMIMDIIFDNDMELHLYQRMGFPDGFNEANEALLQYLTALSAEAAGEH